MKRLKVLSVMNTLNFGGGECRLLSLAKQIDRERFDHIVLMIKRDNPVCERPLGSLRPHFEAANIEIETLNEVAPDFGSAHGTAVKVARSVPRVTRTIAKLASYIRRNRIDLVDTHCGSGNKIGIPAALLANRPVVATTYGLEVFRPLWLWHLSEAVSLSAASAIVTDSDAVAAQIRRKLLRARRISVIPNGIEPPQAHRSREEMRAQFGIPLDPRVRVVGQVASLTPRKGQLVLLDAAHQLVQRDPDVHFLICGYARNPFEYERRLHRRTAELGLSSRVHFVGYPGPIGDVFRAIDIQVHASTRESLPQAIIEGMALGKPAVVTAIAGIPTMVTNGETGIVVPPDDANALAEGLWRLLCDSAFGRRLGKAAQARYSQRYTDERMARSLEKIFVDVAYARPA